jgi:hypothetical protein
MKKITILLFLLMPMYQTFAQVKVYRFQPKLTEERLKRYYLSNSVSIFQLSNELDTNLVAVAKRIQPTQLNGFITILDTLYIKEETNDNGKNTYKASLNEKTFGNNYYNKYAYAVDKQNGVFYAMDDNIYIYCGDNSKELEFQHKVSKLGFKIVEDKEHVYIATPKAKIVLTPTLRDELENGNRKYLQEFSATVVSFRILVGQSRQLIASMFRYYNKYQLGRISNVEYTQWKNQTRQVRKICNKIESLKHIDGDEWYDVVENCDLKTMNSWKELESVLLGSEQILGL